MLFYSRYQSDNPEDFSVELTRMQASMMQYNGNPIYRRPYLYELPETMSYEDLHDALYRTISGHASLQVMFKYDKYEQHYIQYVQYLPPLEEWKVPIAVIDMLPDLYIITQQTGISLSDGYPWRVMFLEYEQSRYLYVEFHGICIDDYSVKCFEDTLFRSLVSGYTIQSGNLSSYRLLRNMEIISADQFIKLRNVKSRMIMNEKNMKMVTLAYTLSEDELTTVRKIADKFSVEIPVVYQLIVEKLIEYCYKGKNYGVVENWRSMLRNYDEIGCFNYLVEESLERVSTLEKHLGLLQYKRQKRQEGEFGYIGNYQDNTVVYWYEEDLCQHLMAVQADQYCAHDLLIRVRRSQNRAQIQLEVRQSIFKKDQVQQCYRRIPQILDSLQKQLLESFAS